MCFENQRKEEISGLVSSFFIVYGHFFKKSSGGLVLYIAPQFSSFDVKCTLHINTEENSYFVKQCNADKKTIFSRLIIHFFLPCDNDSIDILNDIFVWL